MAFDAFFLVVLMLCVGKLCAATRVFPDSAAEVLNQFVLYICLPAAVLRYGARLELGLEIVSVALVPWVLGALAALAVLALCRARGWSREVCAVLLLCVPLGNTSFLGYPLVQAMRGDEALSHAVVYDQFGSFLMLSTYALVVLSRFAGDARPAPLQVLRKILTFPPFITLLLALTVFPAQPPAAIDGTLQRLSDALLPVVAMAVGLQLKLRLPRESLAPLGAGMALKLLLMPALALVWVWLIGMPAAAADAVVLETAMPTMITASALAISHRLAPTLAAAMVGYSLLLSMLTLPLWDWLLRQLAA